MTALATIVAAALLAPSAAQPPGPAGSVAGAPTRFLGVIGSDASLGFPCAFAQDVNALSQAVAGKLVDPAGTLMPKGGSTCDLNGPEATRARLREHLALDPAAGTLVLGIVNHGTRANAGTPTVARRLHYPAHTFTLADGKLDTREYRELLVEARQGRPGRRIIGVHDLCYAGGMLAAYFDVAGPAPGRLVPRADQCGFASTGPELVSSRVNRFEGYALRIRDLAAANPKLTWREAHEGVLLWPDLVQLPLSTSDVYLQEIFRRRAAGGAAARPSGPGAPDAASPALSRKEAQLERLARALARPCLAAHPELGDVDQVLGADFASPLAERLVKADRDLDALHERREALKRQVMTAIAAYLEERQPAGPTGAPLRVSDVGPGHQGFKEWVAERARAHGWPETLVEDAVDSRDAILDAPRHDMACQKLFSVLQDRLAIGWLQRSADAESREEAAGLAALLECEETPVRSR